MSWLASFERRSICFYRPASSFSVLQEYGFKAQKRTSLQVLPKLKLPGMSYVTMPFAAKISASRDGMVDEFQRIEILKV